MLIKHEDVLRELSKRTGYPYEQLRIVFIDFYHQIKIHLQNPEKAFIKGIKVLNCLKFRLNPKQVMISYTSCCKKQSTTYFAQNVYKIFDLLNDNNIFTEKQQGLGQKYQRPNLQEEPVKSSNECDIQGLGN
jgi:hypothetical protein